MTTVDLLGVRVTNASTDEAVALMDRWSRSDDGRTRLVYIVNAHSLNLAWTSPEYRRCLNAADVVFADGTGARLAARWHGVRLRDNLVGTDLVPAFFRRTHGTGQRCFLLGGQPGTPERARARLRQEFTGLEIAGAHHGYVHDGDAARVIALINRARPSLLLVGMGNPVQEMWLDRHRTALDVPLGIGVGGLFDHWAGHLRRAPRWVRRLGIEWVQILLQQPHKWRRYLLGNPAFVARALQSARTGRNHDGHAHG
jgi:N-acetylglucosaminyldiphosphoundecaprenol N-acetyl-beta-D-mannosaminyltransferase